MEPIARFIRLSDAPGELIDNRRGQPELLASLALASARARKPQLGDIASS
jgi:hypothetical protein